MVISLSVVVASKGFRIGLIVPQSPVEDLPLLLIAELSDCFVCMLFCDSNPNLVPDRFLGEELLGDGLDLIEEVNHR